MYNSIYSLIYYVYNKRKISHTYEIQLSSNPETSFV